MEINIKNLSFSYQNRKIMDDLNMHYKGGLLCILGRNGAGKSTLLKLIMGMLKKDSGEILIDDQRIERMTVKERSEKMAYIPQQEYFTYNMPVLDFVAMGFIRKMDYFKTPTKNELKKSEEMLDYLGVSHLKSSGIKNISGGERKMVLLAQALCQNSEVLVFDEPTSQLDYHNQEKFLKLIENLQTKHKNIIMTTHFAEHAHYLKSKCALLKDGKIISYDNYDKLITSEKLSKLYDMNIKVKDGNIMWI